METIRIIIERNDKGYFWGYAENEEGITGGGASFEKCKKDIQECIETLRTLNAENKNKFKKGAYHLTYKFDAESLLQYYKKIFSAPALHRLTGINEKQIHHYATGLKKPRPAQAEKIEKALHDLGRELLTVEL